MNPYYDLRLYDVRMDCSLHFEYLKGDKLDQQRAIRNAEDYAKQRGSHDWRITRVEV